jgi:7-carboxy-7-deazaguanine synthase
MIFTAVQTSSLEPLARKPAGSLLIHEIYRSVQGESTFAGVKKVSGTVS